MTVKFVVLLEHGSGPAKLYPILALNPAARAFPPRSRGTSRPETPGTPARSVSGARWAVAMLPVGQSPRSQTGPSTPEPQSLLLPPAPL